jgi:hypothetical protein
LEGGQHVTLRLAYASLGLGTVNHPSAISFAGGLWHATGPQFWIHSRTVEISAHSDSGQDTLTSSIQRRVTVKTRFSVILDRRVFTILIVSPFSFMASSGLGGNTSNAPRAATADRDASSFMAIGRTTLRTGPNLVRIESISKSLTSRRRTYGVSSEAKIDEYKRTAINVSVKVRDVNDEVTKGISSSST